MIYNVMTYGAAGDGASNDAAAIQAAIDDCAAQGGGQVYFPGGKIYRSGMLILRSNVELHLEAGSVLKGSDHLKDYSPSGSSTSFEGIAVPTYENCEYNGRPSLFFLYARDCEYISITGLGKIDGNEEIFYGKVTPWHIDGSFYPRVPMIFFENVRHLSLLQVTLTGSAFWTVHLVGCDDVLIDGIRIINNLRLANCDGIDPDHCRNVRITNCHIETADDCIVFKNTLDAMEYGPCENILVSGCTLVSTSAAVKFGTESEAIFRNIIVENCSISRSNRGISLQLRDKGCIENITFSNLNIETRMFSREHWWGKAEPVAITAVRRREDGEIGYIRNVSFRNLNCTGENGILIYGDASVNISGISFEKISLRMQKKTDWPKDSHDLRPGSNPSVAGPLCAVYARNAENILFSGLSVTVSDDIQEYMGQLYDTDGCRYVCLDAQQGAAIK